MKKSVTIDVQPSGECQIVKVKGFMDMTQVGHFEKVLDELIQVQKNKIVLDFTELDYISSAGLGVIVGRIRDLREKQGDIRIGGGSKAVQDILNLFGFSEVFCMCASPAEALKSFEE